MRRAVSDEIRIAEEEGCALESTLTYHRCNGGQRSVADLAFAQSGETLDAEGDSHKSLSRPRHQASVGDSISERVGGIPQLHLYHGSMIPNVCSCRQDSSAAFGGRTSCARNLQPHRAARPSGGCPSKSS
jgi:hypothetical protein